MAFYPFGNAKHVDSGRVYFWKLLLDADNPKESVGKNEESYERLQQFNWKNTSQSFLEGGRVVEAKRAISSPSAHDNVSLIPSSKAEKREIDTSMLKATGATEIAEGEKAMAEVTARNGGDRYHSDGFEIVESFGALVN